MHYVSAGPLRVDVEALNDHMRPAGALRLRHAQVLMHCLTSSHSLYRQHLSVCVASTVASTMRLFSGQLLQL